MAKNIKNTQATDSKRKIDTLEDFYADKSLKNKLNPSPLPHLDTETDLARQHGIPEGYVVVSDFNWNRAVDIRSEGILYGFLNPLFEKYGDKLTVVQALERLMDGDKEPDDFDGKWKQAKKRKIGHLTSASQVRTEMAALYRESYVHGLEGSRYFSRLMYMLDCMGRMVQAERKHKKAYEAVPK